MKAIRWGDNDRYFGPFTYSADKQYRPFAIEIDSGDSDDYPGCRLRFSAFGRTLIVATPAIIKPSRRWVDTSHYEWSKQDGSGYWDIQRRVYGFSYSDGHLSVEYGRQTHDSSTEQRWGCFLPWTQWRHVRRSFYDLNGKHFWSEIEDETRAISKLGGKILRERLEIVRKWEEMCPKATFRFQDFDEQELEAVTHIEEREWRFGTGWFKWLSLFRRPKIRRSLCLNFSGETGPEKGSFKGGTIGTSIDMLPGEDHEAAFRRYCNEDHRSKYRKYRVKFIGRKEPETVH